MDRGAPGGREGSRHRADPLDVDPDDRGHALRRKSPHEGAQRVHPIDGPDRARVESERGALVDLAEEGGEEIGVRVRANLQRLPDIGHVVDRERVHEDDLGAALARAAQYADRVGRRQERHLAHPRIRAEEQDVRRVIQISHRMDLSRPVKLFAHRELVRAILCPRVEETVASDRGREHAGGQSAQGVERARIAHVERHGARTISIEDGSEVACDRG